MNHCIRCRFLALTEKDKRRALGHLTLLRQLSFGSQVAEDEVANLQEYFVQTDQWMRQRLKSRFSTAGQAQVLADLDSPDFFCRQCELSDQLQDLPK